MELFQIVSNGNIQKLIEQVKLGININVRDIYGRTLLHLAASGGHVKVFVYLTKLGLNPYNMDSSGRTILHAACVRGQLDMVKYICGNYGRLKEMVDVDKWTALHTCAQHGNVDIFKFLVKWGIAVTSVTALGANVLHIAISYGRYELVKHIVSEFPDLKNKANANKWTCLHYCAQGGSVDIFKFLVNQGLAVTSVTTLGANVLHIAISNGRYELVKHIVSEFPGSKNKANANKWTPLHYCAQGGSVDIFKFLVSQGLDVTSVTSLGENVLHIACYYGRYELVKHIVSEFPELKNKVNANNWTGLHFSAHAGSVDTFKLLVGQGFKLTGVTSDGENVLHIACVNGNDDLVRFIVRVYPKMMEATDTSGQTPLDLVIRYNHQHIFSWLSEHQRKTGYSNPMARARNSGSKDQRKRVRIQGESDVAVHQNSTPPVPPLSSDVDGLCHQTASIQVSSDDCKVKVSSINPLCVDDLSANISNSALMPSDEIPDQDSTSASFPQSTEKVADDVSPSASILQSSDIDHNEGATVVEEQVSSVTDATIRIVCQACQKKATNIVNKASWYCKGCETRLCDECKSNHEVFPPMKHHVIISLQPTCEVCAEGGAADWFCGNCRQYLCGDCRTCHSRMAGTKQHKVISSSDYHRISRDKNSGSEVCIVL